MWSNLLVISWISQRRKIVNYERRSVLLSFASSSLLSSLSVLAKHQTIAWKAFILSLDIFNFYLIESLTHNNKRFRVEEDRRKLPNLNRSFREFNVGIKRKKNESIETCLLTSPRKMKRKTSSICFWFVAIETSLFYQHVFYAFIMHT